MIKLKTILILLFFDIGLQAFANKYYVSNTGNDAADGRTQQTAWQTLTHLKLQSFTAGDTIVFKSGDTWRAETTFNIPWSGSNGNHIIFICDPNWGTGKRARILGSKAVSGWTNEGSNIWSSNNTFNDPHNIESKAGRVFFEKGNMVTWGVLESDQASLSEEFEYYWLNTDSKVYIYSENDPSATYDAVEVPQVGNLIEMDCRYQNAQYLTFDNLELKYATDVLLRGDWPGNDVSGLVIRNCEIAYCGYKASPGGLGINVYHSDMIIENNDIHNCGRRNISMNIDNGATMATISNVIIQDNYLHDGWHTTGVDIGNLSTSVVYDNIIIRRNWIDDDPNISIAGGLASNSIFIKNGTTGQIKNVYIYNNLITNTKSRSINLDITGGSIDSVYIYNNTMWGFNQNLKGGGHIYIDGTPGTLFVVNNITYTNVSGNYNIKTTNLLNTNMDYNLHYTELPATDNFYVNGSLNNQSEWSVYISNTGWEANSPTPADPLFISKTDLRLQPGSPAIGAGVDIPGYTTDFDGNPVSSPPSIGAFQGAGSNSIKREIFPEKDILIFPNPAKEYITIFIPGAPIIDQLIIRIFDISGKFFFEDIINTGQNLIQIPIHLNQGIYSVQVLSGNLTLGNQKIVIVK